jgi:nucleoside-diphosphate-sugar epimerase
MSSHVERPLVLVTGAAGRVARRTAPLLREAFRLRRLDLAEQESTADDEIVTADIRDLDAMKHACAGVRAVLHLAAQPAEADFRSMLLPKNLDGTWSAFEAASSAGVPRFVFASTIQTIDGYPQNVRVTPDMPPCPSSVYGATKLFGEALGRYHAGERMGVASIRLGGVAPADEERVRDDDRFRSLWCAPDDLAPLFVAAINSDVTHATVIAVSPPATERFDTANPFGWTPIVSPA